MIRKVMFNVYALRAWMGATFGSLFVCYVFIYKIWGTFWAMSDNANLFALLTFTLAFFLFWKLVEYEIVSEELTQYKDRFGALS